MLQAKTCMISSACFVDKETRPGSQCEKCRPEISTTQWTHDEV